MSRLCDLMDRHALVLVALNAIVLGIPCVEQWRSRKYDLFHPMLWYAVMYGFPMVIVKGTSLALGAESPFLSLTRDPEASLRRALVYSLLGSICLMIGFYGSRYRRKAPPRFVGKSCHFSVIALSVCFTIGTTALLLLSSEGAFGSSLSGELNLNWGRISWLRPFSVWQGAALFLTVFVVASHRLRGYRGLAVAFAAISLVFAALAGSRSAIFATVLLIIAASSYARYPVRRVGKLMKWGFVAAAALALGVLVISQYRQIRNAYYFGVRITMRQSGELVAESVKALGRSDSKTRTNFLIDQFLVRFVALENLGVTLARHEELRDAEIRVGMDDNIRKELLWGFVPRILFPEKPLIGMFGLLFSRLYLNLEDVTWNGPTVVGDLHRNGGPVAVASGMALLGVVLRWLYERFIVGGQNLPMAALYFFILSRVNWEGTFSPFFTEGIRNAVPLLILTIILEGYERATWMLLPRERLMPTILGAPKH